jgi:hypothetical protein
VSYLSSRSTTSRTAPNYTEGRVIRGQFGSFDAGDPGNFLKVVNEFLQHIALNSRTPVRYFTQSDRGGRGDAPSGDSLEIEDKPLNDKVDRKADLIGNRYVKVAKLVARAIDVDEEVFRRVETKWRDPRFDNRGAVLDEANKMLTLGLPFKWIVTQLGLSQAEVDEVIEMKEAEVQEQEEREMAKMEAQAALQPDPVSGPPGASSSSDE